MQEEPEERAQQVAECWLCGMEARRLGVLSLDGESHDLCDQCYERVSVVPDDINVHRYWYARTGECGLCHARDVQLAGELSHFRRQEKGSDGQYELVEFSLCRSCLTAVEQLYSLVGGAELGDPKDPLPWLSVRLRAPDIELAPKRREE